jgi:hypothetical protein
MSEPVRLALLAIARDIARTVPMDHHPWWIDEHHGTVRDGAGHLIAYIDPTALHLVEQLAALGVV